MNFLLSAKGDSVYAGGLDGKAYAYPLQGGAPRELSSEGLIPGETYLSFMNDGRTVFTVQYGDRSAQLFKMDGITRRHTLLRDLVPEDKSGLLGVRNPVVSSDGRTIAFQARRYLARLYLAEGLR